jgi:crotonobetainyl-CoA:carnitine CoA-transferase CaiB-like acyl-CoA transferase
VADLLAGLQAVQAVLLGLLHREKTGEGQKIVVDMLQSQLSALVYHASRHALTGEAEQRRGNAHRGLVPYDVFPCSDGWIALACGNDGIWRRLREALALVDDPAWRTNRGRVAARADVDRAVSAALAVLSMAEADRLLADAGVPAGPVLDVGQVRAHPAVQEVAVDHPILGRIPLPGPPIRTLTTRTEHRAPPQLGADRDHVLAELGWESARIADALRAGAFGPVPPSSGD